MLDQRMDGRGKDTGILSGSGRRSVKPYVHLCAVLLESLEMAGEPVFLRAHSPFYRLKGSAYTERGPDRWAWRYIK
jgi:hypothetical protein